MEGGDSSVFLTFPVHTSSTVFYAGRNFLVKDAEKGVQGSRIGSGGLGET